MLFFALFACSDRDTLKGEWSGDVECKDNEYVLDIALEEPTPYQYSGQFLFQYTREVADGTFYANLLYDAQATQPYVSGAQDIVFYNVNWSDLGCKTIYDDESELAGGCQSNGLDTSDLETDIGDIMMAFNGIDRLVIDDGNCRGAIYRQ